MRLLSKLSFLFLFAALLFASCDRENFDDTITPDPGYTPETVVVNNLITALQTTTNDGLELGCFSIDYPFELLLEDGTTVEINTLEEFETAAAQESPFQVVDFVFPLTVTTEEEESTQVNSNEELGMMFASCIPDDGWDETTEDEGILPAFIFTEFCYDLVYPVELEDQDDNSYTANNDQEFIDLLATVPNLYFTLPLTVTTEDGAEVLIESVAGFYELYYDCDGNIPPGTEGGIIIDPSEFDGDCDFENLSIQFPYNVMTEDGELITVEDENQEAALILSGVHYTIEYPFNLLNVDGEVITINNEMEFVEQILPCLITIEEPDICDTPAHILLYFNQTCGVITYPNQLTADGIVYDINSIDDYFVVYNMYAWDEISIVYPISVTTPDGTVLTFNTDEEVCAFIDEC